MSNITKYSILAVTLSFIGLPIYVNIGDFYATKYELSLAFLGSCLFIVRFIDIFRDILIGYYSNLLVKNNYSRSKIIKYSLLILIFLFFALFNPPNFNSKLPAGLWLIVILSFTYIFFNIALINYESIAVLIAKNDNERININSFKEFFGVIGLILAALTPYIAIDHNSAQNIQNYKLMTICFALIAIISLFYFSKIKFNELQTSSVKNNIFIVFKNRKFLTFSILYLINSIAIAMPSANIIFYARAILNKENLIGLYLATYLIFAALSIFLWKYLLNRYPISKIWIFAIIGSILSFIIAFFIDQNTAILFIFICILTGFFAGPDLVIPPTIIAKIAKKSHYPISSFFSIYNMLTKIAISFAASMSLFILSYFDYSPTSISNNSSYIIPYLYSLIPCIIRVFIIYLIIKYQKLWT